MTNSKQPSFQTAGTEVRSRDFQSQGHTTGSTHRCQLEGCTGIRVTVRWRDGKHTHPCSKGLLWDDKNHVWRIA